MNRMKRLWATLTAVTLCAGIVAVGSPAGALVPATNGQIVFIRSDPLGNNLAYVANPDGSHQHLLFAGKADFARWSPDGTEVNVRHSDFLAATIVNTDTGSSHDLAIPDPVFACTPTTPLDVCEQTDFGCIAWSPDATRLACSAYSGVDPSRNGIYTIRSSDGGGLTLVKSCPPACAGVGDYSPDGNRLVFIGTDESDQVRVSMIKLDGTGLARLTPAGMFLNDENPPRWSPQGNLILFAARPETGHRYAIWVVRADGTGLHQVPIPSCGGSLSEPTSVGCPEAGWSPDGTKIVFTRVSAKAHQFNIYTVNADGSGLFQVTHNGFKDVLPDWGMHPLGT